MILIKNERNLFLRQWRLQKRGKDDDEEVKEETLSFFFSGSNFQYFKLFPFSLCLLNRMHGVPVAKFIVMPFSPIHPFHQKNKMEQYRECRIASDVAATSSSSTSFQEKEAGSGEE